MNYYELEKKATKGPLTEDEGNLFSSATPIAHVHRKGNGFDDFVVQRSNAKLLAHCRNRFGELLDVLKSVQWVLGEGAVRKRVDAILAKCENVELK